jgi:hypothetical protein
MNERHVIGKEWRGEKQRISLHRDLVKNGTGSCLVQGADHSHSAVRAEVKYAISCTIRVHHSLLKVCVELFHFKRTRSPAERLITPPRSSVRMYVGHNSRAVGRIATKFDIGGFYNRCEALSGFIELGQV